MPKLCEVIPSRLEEHRASKAWQQCRSDAGTPLGIDILKLKKKSAVYRLSGAGPDGEVVIAKRCRAPTARIERIIHEELLGRLPVPALRFYGFLEEPDGQFCWLFLEEAAGESYSPANNAHRALAGEWLAHVHEASIHAGLQSRLPSREPAHYLHLLRKIHSTALEHLSNPVLPRSDVQVLERILLSCALLQSHWRELENVCAAAPRTIVHGDFVVKNVRVRDGAAGAAFLAFDWEASGWGVPATDFAQFSGRSVSPDLRVYSAVRNWTESGVEGMMLRGLAPCGKLFRLIDDMFWATSVFSFNSYDFLMKPISYLKSYENRLTDAFKAAGWT